VTEDRFLGGRVIAAQPRRGFRAGHDTVLLAAAVPAKAGDSVLELGSGAGIASLCLAARVAGCTITGMEIDPKLVELANANAACNAMSERVRFAQGDTLSSCPPPLGEERSGPFDHVFFNPPFHPDTGQVSPSIERDRATRGDVAAWTRRALELIAPNGTVTAIIRADRLGEVEATASNASVIVLPLLPRAGESPKRVIVQFRKSVTGTRTLAGFVLHEVDGRPTTEADAVLRHAAAITLG
jgi:tRNA1(Val) A37 N6-methylase TrmN6